MSIVIGLTLEGRFAPIHFAPPCSSFSRAVNRFMSYALRSFDFPEGLLNLPEAQMLKVELGNVLAEVTLRLAMAQERVKMAWQFEQPLSSLMMCLTSWNAFFSRSDVFHAVVWMCW